MTASFKIICSSALVASIFLSSCASIVSKSNWPVSVQSEPSGVEFIVKKADGTVISNGKTPQIVSLNSGNGFFRPGKYIIETKNRGKVTGSQEVTASINGWYFGNVIFGGLIGLVIVDPLTGAMYRLPETVTVSGGQKLMANNAQSLTIASINTLSQAQRSKLVRI
jgi:hypothetical protein